MNTRKEEMLQFLTAEIESTTAEIAQALEDAVNFTAYADGTKICPKRPYVFTHDNGDPDLPDDRRNWHRVADSERSRAARCQNRKEILQEMAALVSKYQP